VTTATTAVEVEHVTVRFGGVTALDDVSMRVLPGTITGLIGPNGAGKTTLFSVISGLLRPQEGRVRLHGTEVTSLRAPARARLGLARTFQKLELFADMTVAENLMIAFEAHRSRAGWVGDVLTLPRQRRETAAARRRAHDVLELFGLDWAADRICGQLPVATGRAVELARAVATGGDVMLLDEPSAGLDPEETARLGHQVRAARDQGATVLLVEHDMDLVMGICEHIHVLDFGRMLTSGTPAEIRADPVVRAAYLGDEADVLDEALAHSEAGS
jgi:branched-chain amino acid transport system ATP-binding protein